MITTQVLSSQVEIAFEDPRLGETLSYLVHGAKQDLPVRKQQRYEIRGRSPYEVFEEGDWLAHVDSPEDVLYVVYSRIHGRAIERFTLSGWVVYHAAVAEIAGRRMLLLGHSGAGKTTLSARLLYAGHRVEGDELALERSSQVVAVPRSLHLKPGIEDNVPELFDALPTLPHMNVGAIRALDPSRLGFEWNITVGPIDDLIWIAPNHGGETLLQEKEPFHAIRRLVNAAPGWGEPRHLVVASATRLGGRGGQRLLLGDARAAVACLEAHALSA